MKTRVSFLLAMVLGLSLFNCGPDSDDNDNNNEDNIPTNAIVYDGEVYEIKTAILTNYGEWEAGVYNFDVTLLDIEILTEEGQLGVPENSVFSGMYFELFTDNESDLEPGTYSFNANDGVPNTFDYGDLVLNYNVETDQEEGYFEITSGTFTVLENGTTYKFEFEGTIYGGAEFSGNYEGEMLYFDETWGGGRMASESAKNKTRPFSKRK